MYRIDGVYLKLPAGTSGLKKPNLTTMKPKEKIKLLESYLAAYKDLFQANCNLYDQQQHHESNNDEIRALLEESMLFLINFPVNPERMTVKEMIAKNVYYRDNLYAFILERGLLRELIAYHRMVDMLSPGGHERVINYLKSHSAQENPDFSLSLN